MWPYREQREVDELQDQLEEQLGRKLTAREKFYIALSEACLSHTHNGHASTDEQASHSKPKAA